MTCLCGSNSFKLVGIYTGGPITGDFEMKTRCWVCDRILSDDPYNGPLPKKEVAMTRDEAVGILQSIFNCPSDLDWRTAEEELKKRFPDMPWSEIIDEAEKKSNEEVLAIVTTFIAQG